MPNRACSFALLATAALLLSPAQAQQQTAEGAQKFIAILAGDGVLAFMPRDPNGAGIPQQGKQVTTYRWLKDGAVASSGGPYPDATEPTTANMQFMLNMRDLSGANAQGVSDACITKIGAVQVASNEPDPNKTTSGDQVIVDEGVLWESYDYYRKTVTSTFENASEKFAGPHYFDWNRAKVSRANGRIVAQAPGRKYMLEIAYAKNDPEMADRVEYAMKFLKASCDKAAVTGF